MALSSAWGSSLWMTCETIDRVGSRNDGEEQQKKHQQQKQQQQQQQQ